jgi:hypothetical protein
VSPVWALDILAGSSNSMLCCNAEIIMRTWTLGNMMRDYVVAKTGQDRTDGQLL